MAQQDSYGNFRSGFTPPPLTGSASPTITPMDFMSTDAYGNYQAEFTISKLETVAIAGGTGAGAAYEGSGPPGSLVPSSSPAYYIDTDDGSIYWYYDGAWAPV